MYQCGCIHFVLAGQDRLLEGSAQARGHENRRAGQALNWESRPDEAAESWRDGDIQPFVRCSELLIKFSKSNILARPARKDWQDTILVEL